MSLFEPASGRPRRPTNTPNIPGWKPQMAAPARVQRRPRPWRRRVGNGNASGVNDVQPIAPLTRLARCRTVEISCFVAYLAAMVQRVSTIAGWLVFAFIVFATLSPIDDRPVVAAAQLEHFAAFAVLGLAFGAGLPEAGFSGGDPHIGQRVWAGGFAAADGRPSCPSARCRGQSGRRRLRDRYRSAGTVCVADPNQARQLVQHIFA